MDDAGPTSEPGSAEASGKVGMLLGKIMAALGVACLLAGAGDLGWGSARMEVAGGTVTVGAQDRTTHGHQTAVRTGSDGTRVGRYDERGPVARLLERHVFEPLIEGHGETLVMIGGALLLLGAGLVFLA